MVTLKQLFQVFGNDPEWKSLATRSTQPMVSVFMRKLGDRDITTLTDFDIELQLAMCEQPEDRKVKARSCMHYMLQWAKEHGKQVPQIAHSSEVVEQEVQGLEEKGANVPKPKPTAQKPNANGQEAKEHKKHDGRSYVKPDKKTAFKHPEHFDALEDYADIHNINIYDSEHQRGRRSTGTIYHDNCSNGYMNGKRVFKDCWRAEICISGKRYRHRSKDRDDCVAWLKAVKQGRIKPTDNKADWWRMEQHKDETVRFDEMIVSAAEEANIIYHYHQTGDIQPLSEYVQNRLLLHMLYYAMNTLRMGRDRAKVTSRQAIGLLLQRLSSGRPVTNMTQHCKRLLRIHKQRGDFWYYEKAPRDVQMLVDRLDFSALSEIYKITKDKRL